MTCNGIDIYNPFSWIFFAGVCFGGAFSVFLKRKATGYNWIFFCFALSGAVIFGLLAVFIPGGKRIADMRLLYWFCGVSAVSLAGFRFLKSIGLPLTFVMSLVILFFLIGTYPFECFSDNTPVLSFEVLRSGETSVILEQQEGDGNTATRTIDGNTLSAELGMMHTEDFYFFLKGRHLFTAPEFPSESDSTGDPVALDNRYAKAFVTWLSNHHERIPGISFEQLKSSAVSLRPFKSYSLVITESDGAYTLGFIDALP